MKALLEFLMVIQDILDARLQLSGFVSIRQYLTDGDEQFLRLLLFPLFLLIVVEPYHKGDQGSDKQKAEPPTLPEIGCDLDGDGDNMFLVVHV